jgi:hypothetical protein
MLRYLSIGALMLSSATAMAEGPSYSYIKASYQEWELDTSELGLGLSDIDGDGFGVAGSVGFGNSWHIFADYATAEFESVVDIDLMTVGVGYHLGINDNTDFFAELGFAKGDIQFLGDDTGISYKIGVRGMVTPSFELFASIGEMDFDDIDIGAELAAGLWYTVSGNFALGAEGRFADDITRYGVGFRLYFDK